MFDLHVSRRVLTLLLLLPALTTGANNDEILFRDVTSAAGIDFLHTNGRAGEVYVIEVKGSGIAFVDYDDDGDLDLYAVNGNNLPGRVSDSPPTNRLYRSEGDGSFVDVTEFSGAGDGGYGHGVAAADYDNDGDQDLYVVNYGPNVLYRNNGDGTFTDVTPAAGVAGSLWSVSAAFCDLDNDGLLDLYVANYLDYDIVNDEKLPTAPIYYDGQPDALYLNNGDGSFRDVTAERIGHPDGKGLGVVCFDHDNDGDLDLYVANDGVENFLYENAGDGQFEDITLLSGTGVNGAGETEAGMGVDAGDYDGDGDMDLFVTNYKGESNTLMRNDGNGIFSDVTANTNLLAASLPYVAFGTGFFDPDNDGDLDIFVANGHTQEDKPDHAQQDQLFVYGANGRYEDASATAGAPFKVKFVGRGVAFGDYDNDGDIDVVVSNKNGPLNLLQNVGSQNNNWIAIKVRGQQSNRDGIGARISVSAPDFTRIKDVKTGYSMFSSNDPRVYFGLGDTERVDIEIRWPSGKVDSWAGLPANRLVTLTEGGGEAVVGELIAMATSYGEIDATDLSGTDSTLFADMDADELRRRLNADSGNVTETLQLGAAFRRLTKDRGKDLYESAIAANPGQAELHLEFGQFLAYHEVFDTAAEQVATATQLAPDSIKAWVRLATLTFDLGRHAESVAASRAAIKLGDEREATHLGLARGLTALGRTEAAEAALDRLLELHARSVTGLLELGNLLADRGESGKAAATYRRALGIEPNTREARYRLAEVYRRAGDMDDYERHMQIYNLMEEDPDSLAGKVGPDTDVSWLCREIRINPLLVQTRTGLDVDLRCSGLAGPEKDELYSLRTQVSVLSREMAQDMKHLRRACQLSGTPGSGDEFDELNELRLQLVGSLHGSAGYNLDEATAQAKAARRKLLEPNAYDDALTGFKAAMLTDPALIDSYHGLIQTALLTGVGMGYALDLAQRAVLIDQSAKSYDLLAQVHRAMGNADRAEQVLAMTAFD